MIKIKKRFSTCKECDEYKNMKCKICGCFILAKILLKNSHCPLVKWF